MSLARSIVFDSSRPYGPLAYDDVVSCNPKWVRFDTKSSAGYSHGMQLGPLAEFSDKKHVISLQLSNMKQEYGWNAVAVVMNRCRSDNNMFLPDAPQHDLWIYSQFTCPWNNTVLTLVLHPAKSGVDVFVEEAGDEYADDSEESVDGCDDTMPFLLEEDKALWTYVGPELRTRSFEGEWMDGMPPVLGVRLCLGNRVDIVPASQCVLQSLADDPADLVVYS